MMRMYEFVEIEGLLSIDMFEGLRRPTVTTWPTAPATAAAR
jgi:hypothetical protein